MEVHFKILILYHPTSDSTDTSDIDNADIDAECKMNAASSASEKKIEFNIDKWYIFILSCFE